MRVYNVDQRWFKNVRREFSSVLRPFVGKPISYVEVGCWQGASASWVCEHILTHQDSRAFGIDPYVKKDARRGRGIRQAEMDDAYSAMIKTMSRFSNWTFIRESSDEALPKFGKRIDILYLDGRHEAYFVCMDFINAWQWLEAGSVVIFDDYKIGLRKPMPHVPEAINSLLTMFDGLIEPIWKRRQFAVRVVKKQIDEGWHKHFMENPKELYRR